LATFAVLFAAGIALLATFSRGFHVDRGVVQRELIDPYARALAAGEWERAWRSFTTETYRARSSSRAYGEAYAARAATHGRVDSIACATMSGVRTRGDRVIIAASCRVHFADGFEEAVRYSIVGSEGRFAIDGATDGIW
jgi:hypothetical protein